MPLPVVPSAPGARCQIKASADRPLIVEWDAASRNDVEELLARQGAVVVRYNGCEMELLRGCRAPGSYRYVTATRQTESVAIRTADELYARLPIGAVALEGELERAGELRLDMSIVGKFSAANAVRQLDRFQGTQCDGATHVVVGLTAGAFEMVSGASSGASVGVAVAGVSREHEERTLRRAGDRAACERAVLADEHPPAGCGALLRLELVPVECPAGAKLEPGKGCTGANGSVVAFGARGPDGDNHPADAAFARLVLDAAGAVQAALRGDVGDPSLVVHLRPSPEAARKTYASLGGDVRLLLAGGVLGVVDASSAAGVRTLVLSTWMVHPNGQGRWGKVQSRPGKDVALELAAPIEQMPGALKGLYQHLTSAMQGDCDLGPPSRQADFAHVNPDIDDVGNIEKEDDDYRLANRATLQAACTAAAKASGTWLGAYPIFEVALGNASRYIKVGLRLEAGPPGGYTVEAEFPSSTDKR